MKYVFTILTVIALQTATAGEFDWLPDQPGMTKFEVTTANTRMYGLTAVEAASFNAGLQKLRDLIVAQPGFTNPIGVTIDGYMRADDNPPKAKGVPVPAFGRCRSKPCFRQEKTGKPVWFDYTTDELAIKVNNPAEALEAFDYREDNGRLCYEPERIGEIDGFPLFRTRNGDDVIVLSSNGKLPWVPYTREELVNLTIRAWQKQAAENEMDPISPKIVKGQQEYLAKMSPEERKMQAFFVEGAMGIYGPPLAPLGSDLGRPVIRIPAQWYDSSLPRSAIQSIVLRCEYSNSINHAKPGPTEEGSVSAYRLYQYLRSADLKAIAGALTTK
jgi:hypothetical protein